MDVRVVGAVSHLVGSRVMSGPGRRPLCGLGEAPCLELSLQQRNSSGCRRHASIEVLTTQQKFDLVVEARLGYEHRPVVPVFVVGRSAYPGR